LKTLKEFSIQNEYSGNQAYYVKDIEGVQFLTSVIDMDLGGASFLDISPIKDLSNITTLRLEDMARDFRDISPLRGMTNIKKLEIGHNPLVYGHSQIDIESLSYMTQLEELTLYDYQDRFNGNVGAAALSNLVNLRKFYFEYGQLDDGSFIKNMPNLEELSSPVSDIDVSFNPKLKKLTGVNLNAVINLDKVANNIEEVSVGPNEFEKLKSFPNLKSLYFDNYMGTTVDMSMLSNLERLVIGAGTDTVMDHISNLVNLKHLEFNLYGRAGSTDISALVNLKKLESLKIAGSFSGEETINNFTNLKELDISSSGNPQIVDLSMVSNLSNLERITVQGCDNYCSNGNLSDISALKGKTNLKYINLHANNITDISALDGLTNIEFLDLYNNENIKSLDALSGATKMKYLNAGYSEINDISAIAFMNKIIDVRLEGNDILDYSSLGGLSPLATDISIDNEWGTPILVGGRTISVSHPFFKNPLINVDGTPLKIPDTDKIKTVNGKGELDPHGEYLLLVGVDVGDSGSITQAVKSGYPNFTVYFNYDIKELDKSKLAELVKNASQENSTIKSKIANELTTAEGILANDTIFLTQEQIDDIHNKLKEALSNAKNISIEKAIESSAMVAPHTGLSSGGMLMPLVALIIAIITSVFAWQTIRR
jgi:internalin A